MQDDVLLEDFDLIDEGTEWAEGTADDDNVELIVVLNKGELREFPFFGFEVDRLLKAKADRQTFLRNLKVELERDGYQNTTIVVDDTIGTFKVEL